MPDDSFRSLEEARALDASGQRDAALAAYRQLVGGQPELIEGWVELGGLLLVLGHLDEAADACAAALQLDPRHYGALLHAACVQMHKGNLAFAEETFEEALAIDPVRIAGRLMFADCLLRMRASSSAPAPCLRGSGNRRPTTPSPRSA